MDGLLHVLVVTHTLRVRRVGLRLPNCNDILVGWRHGLTMVLDLAFEVLGAHCRVNDLVLFTKELTFIFVSLLL